MRKVGMEMDRGKGSISVLVVCLSDTRFGKE